MLDVRIWYRHSTMETSIRENSNNMIQTWFCAKHISVSRLQNIFLVTPCDQND